jgi:RsiW-degrading membrane proteinase PrsW (M82 family)
VSIEFWVRTPVGLLPVIFFLALLVYLDSYKLVRLRLLLWLMALGGLMALASYFVNDYLIWRSGMNRLEFSRYVAPVAEETLKGLAMVYLFRTNRIGFLVDSAILGFAVGAGFALVENLYYLYSGASMHMGVWIVRGFGTAIMHGGVTAIFGVMAQTLTERSMRFNLLLYVPGLLVAAVLHSVFNHFPGSPILATLGTLLLLPPLFWFIFHHSARVMHSWLELDFDAGTELLEQINSGSFSSSKFGLFLDDLRNKFEGPVVADMLCYLRIYTELAVRAKGLLLMRENGLEIPTGDRTHEKFAELHYLEKSIGKTGLLAMKPFLQMERKDLWQMNLLE